MNDISITSYIAAWGWQILSFICLSTFMLLIAITNNLVGIIFGVAFFISFVGCQYMSHKRKREVYNA